MTLTPEEIKELDEFYGYQEPTKATTLTPEEISELDKVYGYQPPQRDVGEKALRLVGIAGEGGVAGLAGMVPDLPLMALQAGARIPGWLLQLLPEQPTEKGVPVSKASMNMPPETAAQQYSVVPSLRDAGEAANQQIADFTQRLTGKPFFSVTQTVNEAMNKATGLTPENSLERGVGIASQAIGGGKSGNLYGLGAKAAGAENLASNLAGLGATTRAQEVANVLAGGGAGVASQTENKYDDFLLPIGLGLAPLAYQKALSLGGKYYDFRPENIAAQEEAGLPITAQATAASQNKENLINRQASTLGGRRIRTAGEDASKVAEKRLLEEGYDPAITQQKAGQSAVAGMEASTAFDEARAGLLKGRVTDALQGQSIAVPVNWADDIASDIAPQNIDSATLDGLRAKIAKESTLDEVTNRRLISINTLNDIKAKFGRASGSSSAEKQATADAVYSAVKDVEMGAAKASPKSITIPATNQTVSVPEATDLYNQQYREALARREQIVDRATKMPMEKEGQPLYAMPEKTARILHDDVKQNPTLFNEYSEMLSPAQKTDVLAMNMKELGGGEDFNMLKWADEINSLEEPSLNALAYNNPAHAKDIKTLAKAIDLNKNTVGFAGKSEVSPIANNIYDQIMRPVRALGRTGMNLVFGRMLADPKAIKLMTGVITSKASTPVGNYITQLNRMAEDYARELGGGEPNERTKITITPPTPTKIQGTYEKEQEGGGAGNDKLSPDIVHAEGLRLKAYNDHLGNKTVGYGFNMDDPSARKRWAEAGLKTPFQAVKRGRLAITPQEAKQLANYSYKIAANDAKKLYPNFSKLSKNRQQALINMSYQMGLTNLSGFKDANKAIANGRFNAAVRHFAKSRWVRQTPERAKKILTMLWKDVPYDKA